MAVRNWEIGNDHLGFSHGKCKWRKTIELKSFLKSVTEN